MSNKMSFTYNYMAIDQRETVNVGGGVLSHTGGPAALLEARRRQGKEERAS